MTRSADATVRWPGASIAAVDHGEQDLGFQPGRVRQNRNSVAKGWSTGTIALGRVSIAWPFSRRVRPAYPVLIIYLAGFCAKSSWEAVVGCRLRQPDHHCSNRDGRCRIILTARGFCLGRPWCQGSAGRIRCTRPVEGCSGPRSCIVGDARLPEGGLPLAGATCLRVLGHRLGCSPWRRLNHRLVGPGSRCPASTYPARPIWARRALSRKLTTRHRRRRRFRLERGPSATQLVRLRSSRQDCGAALSRGPAGRRLRLLGYTLMAPR